MSTAYAGGRRVSTFVALAAVYLVGMAGLGLAGRFAHALLFEQADERVALWASGATPFDVDFSSREAVILDGSEGVDRDAFGPDGITLQSRGRPIALALRLPRGGLMKSRLASVAVVGESSASVNWQLIGFSPTAQHTATIASGSFNGPEATNAATLQMPGWKVLALQLRLDASPGVSIRLSKLNFIPDFVPNPDLRCYYGREPHGWQGCGPGTVRLVDAPESSVGETLKRNDDSHELFPGIAIEPAESRSGIANAVTVALRAWLRAARSETGTKVVYGVVIGMSLLSAFLGFRRRRWNAFPHKAAMLLLAAAMLLPIGGLPDDALRPGLMAVFAIWLLAAIWLGSRSASMSWWGARDAWRETALLSFISFILLLLLASKFRQPPGWEAVLRYLPWVALQQWLLQRLIRPMAESWTNDRLVVISTSALCFGLLHFPNPTLMLFSAMGAAGWCWLAQRHRALLPLILSHWLLGLAALALLSPTLLRNAEIGSRFLLQR